MKFDLKLIENIEFSADHSSKLLNAMRKIYPDATEPELLEGKNNLENYLKLAVKIAVRLLIEEEGRSFDSAAKAPYDDLKVESNLTHHN